MACSYSDIAYLNRLSVIIFSHIKLRIFALGVLSLQYDQNGLFLESILNIYAGLYPVG